MVESLHTLPPGIYPKGSAGRVTTYLRTQVRIGLPCGRPVRVTPNPSPCVSMLLQIRNLKGNPRTAVTRRLAELISRSRPPGNGHRTALIVSPRRMWTARHTPHL